MRLYLASTSPARLALLRAAGVEPVTIASHVDEDAELERARALGGELGPADIVQLLARAKAEAVANRPQASPDGLVLGGDSMFELDGIVHGKPHTAEAARMRWRAQRGRTGILYSGHWLIDSRGGLPAEAHGAVAAAHVTFAEVTDDEIDAYVATGEPLEVAGAFTIDSLGGPFVTAVSGDPSTVVGLSLSTLRELVARLGIAWPELWNRDAL